MKSQSLIGKILLGSGSDSTASSRPVSISHRQDITFFKKEILHHERSQSLIGKILQNTYEKLNKLKSQSLIGKILQLFMEDGSVKAYCVSISHR